MAAVVPNSTADAEVECGISLERKMRMRPPRIAANAAAAAAAAATEVAAVVSAHRPLPAP